MIWNGVGYMPLTQGKPAQGYLPILIDCLNECLTVYWKRPFVLRREKR